MRKGTISRIFRIFIYNLESIATTDLNFGMINLSLFCYTHKEFRALPISGMDRASTHVDCFQKLLFLCLTNQVGSLGLLRPRNGGSLKNSKKSRFAQYGPFLISYHTILVIARVHNYALLVTGRCNEVTTS